MDEFVFFGSVAGIVVGLLLNSFFALMEERSLTRKILAEAKHRSLKLKGPYLDGQMIFETVTFNS